MSKGEKIKGEKYISVSIASAQLTLRGDNHIKAFFYHPYTEKGILPSRGNHTERGCHANSKEERIYHCASYRGETLDAFHLQLPSDLSIDIYSLMVQLVLVITIGIDF
jgi:hypothetical protein